MGFRGHLQSGSYCLCKPQIFLQFLVLYQNVEALKECFCLGVLIISSFSQKTYFKASLALQLQLILLDLLLQGLLLVSLLGLLLMLPLVLPLVLLLKPQLVPLRLEPPILPTQQVPQMVTQLPTSLIISPHSQHHHPLQSHPSMVLNQY